MTKDIKSIERKRKEKNMLAFIKGNLEEIGTETIVLENHGMGYLIYVPASVMNGLPSIGEEVKIYTYMYVREDQLTLYGFLTKDDMQLFKQLIGVSGIGPKGALGILSTISPNEFRFAVLSGDAKTISKAPGIGAKTAQKLIIELKDKLNMDEIYDPSEQTTVSETSQKAEKEAMMALVSLGYSETEAFTALKKINITETMDSEAILKLALKQMLVF